MGTIFLSFTLLDVSYAKKSPKEEIIQFLQLRVLTYMSFDLCRDEQTKLGWSV